MAPRPLPIDPLLPEIVASLRATPRLVLRAEPGAGKTTRVPPAILDAGLIADQEVWIVQPRRLAARLAARWVAQERGEEVGGVVGYQVRYEDVTSRRTRLRFLTDGLFARRLAADPTLRGVGAVILDEFHERRINGDLGLALVHRLQRARRDLLLVVMSATLAGEDLVAALAPCPLLEATGRVFDVAIEHAPRLDDRRLAQRVRSALGQILADPGDDGDVLVFLPGFYEIHAAAAACDGLAKQRDLELLPLHGSLSPEEQDRAVRRSSRRKVILATNVAETSVTIPGVTTVIDSGLARVAGFDRFSGLPTLELRGISKASAAQRAGRAGRTRAGRCLRLYTRVEHDQRPAFETPEILRADLAEALLFLRAIGLEPEDLPWLDPPPGAALAAANQLLGSLRASAPGEPITALGRDLLRCPAHPRIGRLLFAGDELGVGEDAAVVAAALGERDLRAGNRRTGDLALSDLTQLRDLFWQAKRARFGTDALRRLGVNPAVARRVARARDQLRRLLRAKPGTAQDDPDRLLRRAIFAAFPDRVAVARAGEGERRGQRELRLMTGQRLAVDEASAVRDAQWVVVVAAEQRRRAAGRSLTARLVSAIEPDWILDLCDEGDGLVASEALVWNEAARRVEEVAALRYGELTLDETRGRARSSPEAAAILAARAVAMDLRKLIGEGPWDEIRRLQNRATFLSGALPELGLAPFDASAVESALRTVCQERVALAELDGDALLATLGGQLGDQRGQLDASAPLRTVLPGGRQLEIHYESDRPPWVESWLQDFFGLQQGPSVAQGRVPLTLHLLAPNRRAVQVTTDLANFWREHYPGLKKSLSRRYPRHDWPEDPLVAKPPAPSGRRRRRR